MLSLLLLQSQSASRLLTRNQRQIQLYSRLYRLQMRAFSAAQLGVEDEDSVPENLREDRTLNIAKSSPNIKNDPLISDLLNKEHNMSTLDSFYNGNQKIMNMLHHSFLLYKVNQTYKEVKRRNSPGSDELPERAGPPLETPEQAK